MQINKCLMHEQAQIALSLEQAKSTTQYDVNYIYNI